MMNARALSAVIILLAVLFVTPSARAENDFERGNALYESGNFADAAKAYEKSGQGGAAGSNLYYNLGNAYLRAADKGRAVLNYQRALALRPGHPEAAANLLFLRRTMNLPAPPTDGWIQLAGWIGIDRLSVLAAIAAWLLLAGVIAILGPWQWTALGWSFVFMGAVLLLSSVTAVIGLHGGPRDPARAIIVREAGTKAHYAPADSSRDVQALAVGSEVRVLQERGTWLYAELVGGVRGWIATADADRVVPQ